MCGYFIVKNYIPYHAKPKNIYGNIIKKKWIPKSIVMLTERIVMDTEEYREKRVLTVIKPSTDDHWQ